MPPTGPPAPSDPPALGIVHILAARTGDAPRFRPVLAPWERERAEALPDAEAQAGSVVSAGLLRHAAAMLTGLPPALVDVGRWCRICSTVGSHGRPIAFEADGRTMERVHLSSARADGLVLVAASASGPVGIDVEPGSAAAFDGFDAIGLGFEERGAILDLPAEQRDAARLRAWVRKQAILKATGHGLAVDPSLLDVTDGAVTAWPMQLRDDLSGGVHLKDLRRLPEGFLASLAYLGPASPLVAGPAGVPGSPSAWGRITGAVMSAAETEVPGR